MLCSQRRMKISIILIGILTLTLRVQGQENPDFISLDCGSLENYTDSTINIYYDMDDTYVDMGEKMNISSEALANYQPDKRGRNLRIFPYGTRNCYTLSPRGGNENRYLVRASFLYGNYDGKNKTPVFDLYIGVNYWTTVDVETYIYKEIIYKPTTNYIEVCLVNTGNGTPYLSALELRTLQKDIYEIDSGFLQTKWRLDIGGNESYTTTRFADDPYDRLWRFTSYVSMVVKDNNLNENNILTSEWIESNQNEYHVPGEVLKTAQVSVNNTTPLSLRWPSNSTDKWCIFFHFAEIENNLTTRRQLSVSVNGKPSGTASLEYLKPQTLVSPIVSDSEIIRFEIVASESSLPPILNAVEIFLVQNLSITPTHADDVGAMRDIKKTYKLRRESWQGDPCVPKAYIWDGLSCKDDNPPRITSLNLSSSGLAGNIATELSNLSALVYLDLSNNQLSGEIPEALAKLSNLKFLNLTGNNLTGSIPKAMKRDDLTVLWDGDKNKEVAILPIVAPVLGLSFLILFGATGVYWWRSKRRRGRAIAGPSNESKLKAKNRPFTYNEVLRITNNFDTIIGEGGFGMVYLGTLDNGIKVAVKMLSLTSKQGYKEFEAEAQLLMVVHHRNLVSLVGYCDDIRNIALIYEYMPAGNLREHFSEKNSNPLSWIQRLQIAVDAAQGLDYLHHGCKPPIIHRDLKSPNILLNENMQAKIADFGLSKAFGTENESYISTRPAGTPGYLDPEFQSTGNLSRKSDVYSFGIILFELITGQSAILRGPNGNIHILHWVTPFIERGDVESIMDPRLKGNFSINSAWKAVEIAMSCVPATAIQRPDINHVLQELKECLDAETSGSHDSFRITTLEVESDNIPLAR